VVAFTAGSVLAVNERKDRPLDRQNFGVIDFHKTHSSDFVTLSGWGPSDSMHMYAREGIVATLSVTVQGGPFEFQMFMEDVEDDWAIRPMYPEAAAFDPGTGTVSRSFSFDKGSCPATSP